MSASPSAPEAAHANGLRLGRAAAALALILLVALLLRGWQADCEAAWHDEALTALHADARSLGEFLDRAFTQDKYPRIVPVYFVLQHYWARLAGDSLLALRWLSILLGAASAALVYAIGRLVLNERAARWAAFLLAVSLAHVYFSQEVRFYALLVFLGLLSMYGFAAALFARRAWGWPLHGAANVLLMGTHAFAPFLFMAQGICLLLLHPRPVRRWLAWGLAHAALLAAFLAWMRWSGYAVGGHLDAFRGMPGSARDFANALVVFAGGRFTNRNPGPYMLGGVSLDLVIAAGIGCASAWFLWRRVFQARDPAARRAAVLLGLWAFAPLAALFVLSHLWQPVFIYRYVLYSLPAVCLLAGAGFAAAPGRARVQAALFAAAAAAFAWQHFAVERPIRPDYAAAARQIESKASERTRVHAFKKINELAFQYASTLPPERILEFEGFPELVTDSLAAAAAGKDVWALFYLWERVGEFEDRAREAGFRIERSRHGGLPPLYLVRLLPGTAGSGGLS